MLYILHYLSTLAKTNFLLQKSADVSASYCTISCNSARNTHISSTSISNLN